MSPPSAHNLGNGNQIRDGLEPCLPYRTRDASGCPTDAGTVAWNWISGLAQQQREQDAALLVIQDTPVEGGGKVIRLYRSTTLLAVATTFRDEMNFTVFVGWKSPELATRSEANQSSLDTMGGRPTPAMIKAGVDTLYACKEADEYSSENTVRSIFRAMAARRLSA